MHILTFVGSLRAESFSRKLAVAAEATAPDGTRFTSTDARDLPHYDQDLDGDEKPAAVQTLLDQVTAADALLFVTPEFNYGIPGPLKNAIDWASRPAYRSPLKNKPALVISQSIAPTGGVRAHTQLVAVLGGTLTPIFNGPAFNVPAIHEKFDEAGALTDELVKARLTRTLEDFTTWARALGGDS